MTTGSGRSSISRWNDHASTRETTCNLLKIMILCVELRRTRGPISPGPRIFFSDRSIYAQGCKAACARLSLARLEN